MFDNVFIALKPLLSPPPTNKKVSCIELFGSEILNVEVVDSPEVSVNVCYSMWCHITEDYNLNILIVLAHYCLAVLNKLNAYDVEIKCHLGATEVLIADIIAC